MRTTWLVTGVLIGSACSSGPAAGDDDTSTTMMEGDGDGTETGPGADLPSGDGDGDPSDNPCGCEEGQLCVGDCVYGDAVPDWVAAARCIDASSCDQRGLDSFVCMAEACGAEAAERLPSCGEESAGYDILCDIATVVEGCEESLQDCPEGEKCVAKLPNLSNHSTSECVPIEGSDAAGEPCTSQGAGPDAFGKDSCDAASMCWNGSLTAEPFAGICHPYCDLLDDLSCPDSMSCVEVVVDFHLCLPNP